jgi:hypothetical protein
LRISWKIAWDKGGEYPHGNARADKRDSQRQGIALGRLEEDEGHNREVAAQGPINELA